MAENDGNNPVPPVVPVQNPPAEVTLDLGNGNLMNRQQALDLKTAKDGVESEFKAYKQTTTEKIAELEKSASGYVEASRTRIEAEAAKETAEAKVKELELRVANHISPDVYGKMKETNDLLILKTVSDKVDNAVTKYGVDKAKFDGKSETEIDAYIEGLAGSKPSTPGTPPVGGGQAQGQHRGQTEHEKNVQKIEEIWGKSK